MELLLRAKPSIRYLGMRKRQKRPSLGIITCMLPYQRECFQIWGCSYTFYSESIRFPDSPLSQSPHLPDRLCRFWLFCLYFLLSPSLLS